MGFFATHVVPTVLYVLKKLTFPLSLFAMLAPAPQEVVDKNVDAMAAAANKSQARLPRALNQMVGTWKLQEKINVDQFMAGLGIKGPLRAALRLAGQQQELLADTGALTIVTSDLRGRSALKLPLNGRGVVAHDGDGGAAVRRSAYVQKDAGACLPLDSPVPAPRLTALSPPRPDRSGRDGDARRRVPAPEHVPPHAAARRPDADRHQQAHARWEDCGNGGDRVARGAPRAFAGHAVLTAPRATMYSTSAPGDQTLPLCMPGVSWCGAACLLSRVLRLRGKPPPTHVAVYYSVSRDEPPPRR